jgi:diadenylate cyclase
VIISDERIAAAACFLPLSVSPLLDKNLGTRHRAAMGLTEETDALAVVISEERGEISLARQGRLSRGLTTDDLRNRLRALLLHRRAEEPTAAVELDA